MFGNWKKRRANRGPTEQLTHRDAHMLRDIGLNPDDFRDAFEGRNSSLLFEPFRDTTKR